MLLYKYLSPERIDVLENQMIRFSQVGALNDPFEGLPRISPTFIREFLPVLAEHTAHPDLRATNEKAFLGIYFRSPKEFQDRVSVNQFIATECDRAAMEMDRRLSEMASLPDEELAPFAYEIAQKFQSASCGKFGVLSLSETETSASMWDRYSDAHKGFAIALDSTTKFFETEDLNSATTCFRKMIYTSELPCLSKRHSPENDLALFYTKLDEWASEHEWRLLRRLESASDIRNSDPWPVHLFDIPSETIREIILGYRMSQENEEKIRATLAQRHLDHVGVRRIQVTAGGLSPGG